MSDTLDNQELPQSRFTMWRAVIAMVHADGVVTPHELSFINDNIKGLSLSEAQLNMIAEDLQIPQDTYDMYAQITKDEDKRDFFVFARALSWSDGDFDCQEKAILNNLEKIQSNEETMSLLGRSREVVQEIELKQGQWNIGASKEKKWNIDLFGFLSNKSVNA